ncbi:hypothetical protein HWI79_1501 [Cryptosporidium felis]|nr:hypothetical protein HWI79_1501 [Cryptosporidium felis]
MEGLPIQEIYINSDMILSFDENSFTWNETEGNSNTSKNSNNTQNASSKLNVNVNVNVNGNVSCNHSSAKCNVNSGGVSEEDHVLENFNLKSLESCKKTSIDNKKVSESSSFFQDETSQPVTSDNCFLKENNQYKHEDNLEKLQNSHFSSSLEKGIVENKTSELESMNCEEKVSRRRRGDPKLCWRCHKRDATPHMRSCEPCRVADRQRWSRRRNLSKFLAGNGGLNSTLTLESNILRNQLKAEHLVPMNQDKTRLDGFNNGYIQNSIHFKYDSNQCISGTQEHSRSMSTSTSHSNGIIPISGISLAYPLRMDQWRDQQFSFKDNRGTQTYTDVSQNLSYITISYFPSPLSGLTTLPVSAKFASDGSVNGLETLPSVVLSFIVDRCNEQLLQRQIGRQNNLNMTQNNSPNYSQVELGLGNILTSNNETIKNMVTGNGGCSSFHNIHYTNFHCNTLDQRLYY